MPSEQEPERNSVQWHIECQYVAEAVCLEAVQRCGEEAGHSWKEKAEAHRSLAAHLRRLLEPEGAEEAALRIVTAERDQARAAYTVAFRLVAELWDATGDAFDELEAPVLLWPSMIQHPSQQVKEAHDA